MPSPRTARPPGIAEDAIPGYRIIAEIGAGGMGTIYRAEHRMLGRQVALKVLSPSLVHKADLVQRFLREMRTLATVTSDHVVACHDAGENGSLLWIAQELVSGGDAEQWLNRTRRGMPAHQAASIIADACRGVEAVAAAGLLHRDIKPSNIFMMLDGRAKLGDFGLARPAEDTEHLTMTGHVYGTPAYMSPEQACGEDLDVRTDLYGLGAACYTLLTKSRPFSARNTVELIGRVLNDPVPDPRQINPELPPAMTTFLRQAMAKEAANRFQTPRQMIAALEPFQRGDEIPMAATIRIDGDVLVVTPAGAIGVDDHDFWQNIDQELEQRSPRKVVVDGSQATFMTSEGIAHLLSLRQAADRLEIGFALCNLGLQIAKSLRMVKLDRILTLAESYAAAKA